MRRHLNTLYVTTQGSYLSKDGDTVSVSVDGRERARVPIHNLESVVCFGRVSFSPFLLGLCGERGVHVSFLSRSGRFLARMEGPTSGNVLLRREQFRRADHIGETLDIARNLVLAKLANCRSVLQRARRDHPDRAAQRVGGAIDAIAVHISQAQSAPTIESLRGLEGGGSREYFGVFNDMITQQSEDFRFAGRSRRPPLDRVNALLSFVYTLLVNDVTGGLEAHGLDPQVGFLHRFRPGRVSLSLDIMEEMRSFLADRLVLSLINREQITAHDFRVTETGAVLLDDAGRKNVLLAYQSRKDDQITHPFLKEKITIGSLPHMQALLMARCLRGDLTGYPAFISR